VTSAAMVAEFDDVAVVAERHRTARAYAVAARQGERLSRLFATEQVSIQLIHAIRFRDEDNTGADQLESDPSPPTGEIPR
jgi:hypothetical protein